MPTTPDPSNESQRNTLPAGVASELASWTVRCLGVRRAELRGPREAERAIRAFALELVAIAADAGAVNVSISRSRSLAGVLVVVEASWSLPL